MIYHLTDAGRLLLEGSMVDCPEAYGVRFTRVEFGNGPAQDAADATALNNPILTGLFANEPEIDAENNCIKMTATVSNESLNVGFNVTEAGYFAGKLVEGSDTVTDVVLFAIGNDTEGEAFRIPSKAEYVNSFDFELDLFVSDVENINAILNENASYAFAEDFRQHITDYGNPHKVNKAQVGLPDVPNRTTNDQTPTFTEANILALLNGSEEDGDTLQTLFSKLAKGQHDFMDHKSDTNNPHSITAEKIGASKAGHTHETSEVVKGVFPIERGGTGLSTGANFIANGGYVCRGCIELPGGLLVQWGRVFVDGTKQDVQFARSYANEAYALLFTTSSDDLVPVWKNPTKSKDGFTMERTFGANSNNIDNFGTGSAALDTILAPLRNALKWLFKPKQVADWLAIGEAAQKGSKI